jgi:hypothetical protein
VRTGRALWFTTPSCPSSGRSGAAASPYVQPHGDQPIRDLICIAGSSVKMVAFDFSDFAQRRDDRGFARCGLLGAASIIRCT